MLHLETVTPETLDLIRKLMQEKCLEHFKLVGGTALALKLGHRTSVDIDLFSNRISSRRRLPLLFPGGTILKTWRL